MQRKKIAMIAKKISLAKIKKIHEDNALLTTLRQAYPKLNTCKKNPGVKFKSILLHINTPAAA